MPEFDLSGIRPKSDNRGFLLVLPSVTFLPETNLTRLPNELENIVIAIRKFFI